VAQLGARFHGMEEVIGSIPIRSTNKPNNLADSQKNATRFRSVGLVLHPPAALSTTFLERSKEHRPPGFAPGTWLMSEPCVNVHRRGDVVWRINSCTTLTSFGLGLSL
jgi:hypothetical protein